MHVPFANLTALEAIPKGNRSRPIPVANLTAFEAIHKGNTEQTPRRPIAPNSFFNKLLLGKDARGRFKPIPNEFRQIRNGRNGWFAGDAFVVSAKGKGLEKNTELEFTYKGKKKIGIYRADQEHCGRVDIMLLCRHGFAGRIPFLDLLNAKGKPIADLGEADEIQLIFNGEIVPYRVTRRDGGLYETVTDEKTGTAEKIRMNVTSSPAFGLLERGHLVHGLDGLDIQHYIVAGGDLNVRCGAVFLSNAENLVAKASQTSPYSLVQEV